METPDPIEKPVRREWYLDNLKVFLTILVIFHHAEQAYSGSDNWVYQPSLGERAVWLREFFAVNASFFMGLFFLISGYFVPASYDRHGFSGFVRTKFVHLGIPLLVVVVGNSAIVHQLEFAHLWFVEHLLVYSLLYALSRLVVCDPVRVPGKLNFCWILGAGAVVAAFNFLLRALWPVNTWIFWGRIPAYGASPFAVIHRPLCDGIVRLTWRLVPVHEPASGMDGLRNRLGDGALCLPAFADARILGSGWYLVVV